MDCVYPRHRRARWTIGQYRGSRFPGSATNLLIGAALALLPLPARGAGAQSGSLDPAWLTLGELYRETRDASPRIAAARALARAADARVASARRPPDPELQLGFMNYELPDLEPMEPLGMTQLQLMQMVPTAGKLGLAGRVAASQAAAASERANEIQWEQRAAVAMRFYELYEIDRTLDVARETIRLLEDIRRTAESMYRVGEGRQVDVLRAQVEIARMQEDTLRMTAMRTAVTARLNALVNRSAGVALASPAIPRFPDSLPSLELLLEQSQRDRPMVRAGEREVQSAVAGERLARREIWPDLTIGLQYGQRRATMPGDDPSMPATVRTERMGSLMIGASVPIFARSRQLRMRDEALAMRRMAEADLAAMRADTRGRVMEVYADLRRARALAELYRTTVLPQAEAAVTSALSAYRVGGVDFMTLLDNRMTVNRYRQELFALDAEQGTAWAELEMLVGRELIDPDRVNPDTGVPR